MGSNFTVNRDLEAEYIASIKVGKKSNMVKVWLVNYRGSKRFLFAIYLTSNQLFQERTKCIDIRLHLIKDMSDQMTGEVKKISIGENLAHMLTKPVPKSKFELFLSSPLGAFVVIKRRVMIQRIST